MIRNAVNAIISFRTAGISRSLLVPKLAEYNSGVTCTEVGVKRLPVDLVNENDTFLRFVFRWWGSIGEPLNPQGRLFLNFSIISDPIPCALSTLHCWVVLQSQTHTWHRIQDVRFNFERHTFFASEFYFHMKKLNQAYCFWVTEWQHQTVLEWKWAHFWVRVFDFTDYTFIGSDQYLNV